jgi:hypothetical protein
VIDAFDAGVSQRKASAASNFYEIVWTQLVHPLRASTTPGTAGPRVSLTSGATRCRWSTVGGLQRMRSTRASGPCGTRWGTRAKIQGRRSWSRAAAGAGANLHGASWVTRRAYPLVP